MTSETELEAKAKQKAEYETNHAAEVRVLYAVTAEYLGKLRVATDDYFLCTQVASLLSELLQSEHTEFDAERWDFMWMDACRDALQAAA
jgi:hypothetical protein